jgi:hypothetical protein
MKTKTRAGNILLSLEPRWKIGDWGEAEMKN